MKLYYIPGTCSLSPHIVLREIGANFELERVNNDTKTTASGENFLEVNPKGYVAALRLDNGQVLTEGSAIVLHLADAAGHRLSPPIGTMERARLYEMLVYISSEVHQAFGQLFHPASAEAGVKARAKVESHLSSMNAKLSGGKQYLLGDTISLADIYLFVVVRWTDHLSIDMAAWPHLQQFMKRIEERPTVQAALAAEGL